MNFLLKKLFRKYIKPEQEANFLVRMVSSSAYEIFLDQRIRQLINFDEQTRVEQDRIFNELVVTALVLLKAIIEYKLPDIEPLRQDFWQNVYHEIQNSFINWLAELGVERKYLNLWHELIDLRYDEYKERRFLTKQTLEQELAEIQEDEDINEILIRTVTLAISSMLHITRNKARPDDPLKKHLKTWLMVLDLKLEKRIGW